MAKDDSTDLLMRLVNLDGSPVETECQTILATASEQSLLFGFQSATPGARANFFEIDDVDLGFELKAVGKASLGHATYGLDMGDATVDRTIDCASPILMKAVFTTTPFKSATIVKRRGAGTSQSGSPYLRMQFTGILLTKIAWSDGHAVKEKLTFIYRGVQMQYKPQSPDGRLLSAISGSWSMA